MNSIEINPTISEILEDIRSELNKYKDIPKNELFTKCLNQKLQTSLERYNLELNMTTTFLEDKEVYNVMKTITKMQKERDKQRLKESLKKDNEDDADNEDTDNDDADNEDDEE